MPKTPVGALLPSLRGLDSQQGPLHRQLSERVRAAILAGTLAPGSRLPSTRTLARDLGVSRSTVELAFSDLSAEGFLERRVGAGSTVSLPEDSRLPRAVAPLPDVRATAPALSRQGKAVVAQLLAPDAPVVLPFTPCLPAVDAFPVTLWQRALSRQVRALGSQLLGTGEPGGLRALREAIASHLTTARGVRCDWRRVLIVSSTQQSLDLAARLLLDPGDTVWMEEPGYLGARLAFAAAGARLCPVPVDREGLRVEEGVSRAPTARLAYVTPSHQYPLGGTLSAERRRALLEWARQANAWVFEDDYDSELRYTSQPLAAVQAMDEAGRVLYAGTFNKALFPAMRLAYLVVPETLVEAFGRAKALADGQAPLLPQAALADFMERGHFAAHLRRMRQVYGERRDSLLDALRRETSGFLQVGPTDAGMHVSVQLPAGTDDVRLVQRAAEKGLDPRALSALYLGEARTPGLVLGFSGAGPAELRRAVRVLAALL
ncbi:MAG: PLP-dependent aminotransferase family protein [Myxococcaceae bacterium]|nr:PLP-dependent aminotransferase family protein [Myxococcaceae bacterium]MCI0669405.1 PLP-dependent aminotransferase family protein [Myxococcaceae bacterium]